MKSRARLMSTNIHVCLLRATMLRLSDDRLGSVRSQRFTTWWEVSILHQHAEHMGVFMCQLPAAPWGEQRGAGSSGVPVSCSLRHTHKRCSGIFGDFHETQKKRKQLPGLFQAFPGSHGQADLF